MRVVLVGPAVERARMRAALTSTSIEVVGEAATLAEADELEADTNAFIVAALTERTVDASQSRERSELDEPLTRREIDVLELLAEGLPNKAIAARLDISDQTVKFHVSSICGKLGAANRTDAVRRGVRRGLITL
jgi:NarL family two-component system response regulator YdfI